MQEDNEEGSDEVVDALDVTRCWVPDGPDIEDAFKHLLHHTLLEQWHQR